MYNSLKNNILARNEVSVSISTEKKYSKNEVFQIIEDTVKYTLNKAAESPDFQKPKHKFPYKLPVDFKWEKMTIKFIKKLFFHYS